MKKSFAKITVVLLVLAMALTMTACASDQEKMVGSWQAEVDFAAVFNASLGEGENAAYLTVEHLPIKMTLTFTEEGTYTMTADAASVSAAMESLKDTLEAGMGRYLVDTVGAAGVAVSLDQIMSLMGVTMEELIDQVVTQDLIEEMASGMTSGGKFQAEDGKLWMSDSVDKDVDAGIYDTYMLEEDQLTLVTTSMRDAYTDLLYPMTFQRVS